MVTAALLTSLCAVRPRRSRLLSPHPRAAASSGPTARDHALCVQLLATPSPELQPALSAVAAAGELSTGLLEAVLQLLQAARQTQLDCTQLAAVARSIGVAIELQALRARLPPAVVLLDDVLNLQASGAELGAISRALAGAFASGLPAAEFASTARRMVTSLDAEEKRLMASVAAAVEGGGPEAEQALAAAEKRREGARRCAELADLADELARRSA